MTDRSGVSVSQHDRGVGLAAIRAGLGPRTLVTYARDHIAVRTPSRGDFRDGNALHLLSPPRTADELARWLDRFDRSIGGLPGVRHVQVRWEEEAAQPGPLDPALTAAVDHRGLAVEDLAILTLDDLASAPAPAGTTVRTAHDDRDWYAVEVLYRWDAADLPDELVRWRMQVQRELVDGGSGTVWLASRHGIPAAKVVIAWDGTGVASVEDVVTHPAHRGLGLASALVATACAAHRSTRPGDRLVIGADPDGAPERLYRRLGFVRTSVVRAVVGDRRS